MTRTTTSTNVIDVAPKAGAHQIRTAGAACALGGLALAAGAIATQVVQASTSVSDQLWRYPWGSRTAVINWAVWGSMQALVLIGVLAWRRSGVAGSGRAARVGLPLAALGTALIIVGQFASISVRNQTVHDTGAQLVGGIFAVGTVLSALGLVLAGWATLHAGGWRDWRRFVPLAIGVVTVALIGLQFTKVLPTGVAVYSLGFAALGVALMRGRHTVRP
jgi:hypothetical protein